MFQTKVVEKITKYVFYVQKVPPPPHFEIMWKKCCGDKKATDDNIIQDRKGGDLNAG
jgi:hypothetical protein